MGIEDIENGVDTVIPTSRYETMEQALKDGYTMNLTVGWAKNRLRILIEMMQDRLGENPLPPLNPQWVIDDLKKTMNGLQTIVDIEENRKKPSTDKLLNRGSE